MDSSGVPLKVDVRFERMQRLLLAVAVSKLKRVNEVHVLLSGHNQELD